jgi:hypothetical protein
MVKRIHIIILLCILVFSIASSQGAKSILLGVSISDLGFFSDPFNPSNYNVSFHYFATDKIEFQARLSWPFYNLQDYGLSLKYHAIDINNVSNLYFQVGCSQSDENYFVRDSSNNNYFKGALKHFGLNIGVGVFMNGYNPNQWLFIETGYHHVLSKSISFPAQEQSKYLPSIESIWLYQFAQEGYAWSINK